MGTVMILTDQRILVGGGDNLELLGGRVVTEPAPARALDGGSSCVELLFQACDVTV